MDRVNVTVQPPAGEIDGNARALGDVVGIQHDLAPRIAGNSIAAFEGL